MRTLRTITALMIFAALAPLSTLAQTLTYFTVPPAIAATSASGRAPGTTSAYTYHRSAHHYPTVEIAPSMQAGDTVKRLGYVISTVGTTASGNIKIYMKNSSDATFLRSTTWASYIAASASDTMQLVYNGPLTVPATTGGYSVLLSTPFVYTGQNLYVGFEWQQTTVGTVATTYFCNNTINNAQYNAQSASAFPATLTGGTLFRPGLYLAIPARTNDLAVSELYTLGKLPIPFANPHTVKVRVKNTGQDPVYGKYAYLTVTGVNARIDSVYLGDTLAPGVEKLLSYTSYSPSVVGYDTLTASVKPDQFAANNSKRYIQYVNLNTYNYADPSVPSAGGVGFTGGTGDFVAKFPYTGSNAVNQVGVNFNSAGVTLQVGIWDTSATGTPGTLLWTSAPFTTVTGTNTIPVNPPATVTGSFFVGVRQTGTTNAAFSYQTEAPIRPSTFYYTAPTGGTTWTDFSASSSNFRFMIEPRLQIGNDVGVTEKLFPCVATVQNTAPFSPQARIYNYGALSQPSLKVKCRITGPVNYFDSTTTSISPGTYADVTFPGTFNPTTVGTYTIKMYTELAGDGDPVNDTLVSTFVVNNLNLGNTAVNRLAFDGVDDHLSIPASNSMNPFLEMTVEAWVAPTTLGLANRTIISRDTSKAAIGRSYTMYINTAGRLVFVLHTTAATDSVTSSFIMTAGTMYHVAAVYDGLSSLMRLYVNGDTAGTKTISGTLPSVLFPVTIGRFQAPAVDFFAGQMDEIRVWNVARSADSIRYFMHTRLANQARANLVLYLRLDEGVGSSITTDASGNCNSASLNNMDFNNGTATPAWVVSTLPLGTPAVSSQQVFTSGLTTFTGTNLSMQAYNYVGNENYVVHQFAGAPLGTQPSTSPGGVTNVHNKYWLIYKYGSATYDSIVPRFGFAGGNMLASAAVPADVRLFRRANSASLGWTADSTAIAVSVPSQYADFTIKSATSFNQQFSIGANNNSLPVELLAFNGRRVKSDAMLTWTTASEVNNQYFGVERSLDVLNFVEVGQVEGAMNSVMVRNYQFNDLNVSEALKAISGHAVYYRLRQVDADGSYTYSKIVRVSFNEDGTDIVTVFPNPFVNEVALNVNSKEATTLKLSIADLSGRVVYRTTANIASGDNTVPVECNELNAGVYFVTVELNNKVFVQKVVRLRN